MVWSVGIKFVPLRFIRYCKIYALRYLFAVGCMFERHKRIPTQFLIGSLGLRSQLHM